MNMLYEAAEPLLKGENANHNLEVIAAFADFISSGGNPPDYVMRTDDVPVLEDFLRHLRFECQTRTSALDPDWTTVSVDGKARLAEGLRGFPKLTDRTIVLSENPVKAVLGKLAESAEVPATDEPPVKQWNSLEGNLVSHSRAICRELVEASGKSIPPERVYNETALRYAVDYARTVLAENMNVPVLPISVLAAHWQVCGDGGKGGFRPAFAVVAKGAFQLFRPVVDGADRRAATPFGACLARPLADLYAEPGSPLPGYMKPSLDATERGTLAVVTVANETVFSPKSVPGAPDYLTPLGKGLGSHTEFWTDVRRLYRDEYEYPTGVCFGIFQNNRILTDGRDNAVLAYCVAVAKTAELSTGLLTYPDSMEFPVTVRSVVLVPDGGTPSDENAVDVCDLPKEWAMMVNRRPGDCEFPGQGSRRPYEVWNEETSPWLAKTTEAVLTLFNTFGASTVNTPWLSPIRRLPLLGEDVKVIRGIRPFTELCGELIADNGRAVGKVRSILEGYESHDLHPEGIMDRNEFISNVGVPVRVTVHYAVVDTNIGYDAVVNVGNPEDCHERLVRIEALMVTLFSTYVLSYASVDMTSPMRAAEMISRKDTEYAGSFVTGLIPIPDNPTGKANRLFRTPDGTRIRIPHTTGAGEVDRMITVFPVNIDGRLVILVQATSNATMIESIHMNYRNAVGLKTIPSYLTPVDDNVSSAVFRYKAEDVGSEEAAARLMESFRDRSKYVFGSNQFDGCVNASNLMWVPPVGGTTSCTSQDWWKDINAVTRSEYVKCPVQWLRS